MIMKKRNIGFTAGLIIAFVLSFYQFVLADNSWTVATPDTTSFNQSYATMDLHTSVGQFYNLSSTTYQQIGGFGSSNASGDMTVNTSAGSITIGTSGTYLITWTSSFKADEGAIIEWDLRKNGTSIQVTQREMTGGPERAMSYITEVNANAVMDVVEYITKTYTNTTSMSVVLPALATNDGRYLHIDEASGQTAPAFSIIMDFAEVDSPGKFITNGTYAGHGGHDVKAYSYNFAFTSYTAMSVLGKDYPDNGLSAIPTEDPGFYPRELAFPKPRKDYVNSSGISRVKIDHVAAGANNGYFELDSAVVKDALNSLVVEVTEIESLTAGDVLTWHVRSNTAGTEYYNYGQMLKAYKIGL